MKTKGDNVELCVGVLTFVLTSVISFFVWAVFITIKNRVPINKLRDMLIDWLLRRVKMNVNIVYYYESDTGVHSMLRTVRIERMAEIDINIKEMNTIILENGWKPLNTQTTFE